MSSQQIKTFGDARRLILDTICDLRANRISVDRGMAIAANMKVLNDSILAEVAAAKLSMATEGKAHNFGRLVAMGQRTIDSTPIAVPNQTASPAE